MNRQPKRARESAANRREIEEDAATIVALLESVKTNRADEALVAVRIFNLISAMRAKTYVSDSEYFAPNGDLRESARAMAEWIEYARARAKERAQR